MFDGALLDVLRYIDVAAGAAVAGAAKMAFFKTIFAFLGEEIDVFRENLLGRMAEWVSAMALLLLTIWLTFKGYRIATGQSRDSLSALVTDSLKAVLIVVAATTLTLGGNDIYRTLTDGVPKEITELVTGDDSAPEDKIDDALTHMEAAFIAIDALAAAGSDPGVKQEKDRALLMTGIGVAGPSVVGGAMLLMYKIAMALFIGLGPLFILTLMFEQTKSFFAKWLYYGIGTMFSLGVLAFMVAVALKMIIAVAAAFAVQYAVATALGGSTEGVSGMAMQQGGLGIILTLLIITAPAMAAAFFQGTLGHFNYGSGFGGGGRDLGGSSNGRQPGQSGYMPASGQKAEVVRESPSLSGHSIGPLSSAEVAVGAKGQANQNRDRVGPFQ